MKPIVLAAVAAIAVGDSCFFNRTANVCPRQGQACNQNILCQAGTYCRAQTQGLDSYSGFCDVAPNILEVYGKPCNLGNEVPECVYQNPLALSPRDPPATLQCVRAFKTDSVGTCRIGPNKHGDACNQNGECASGHCQKELGTCEGIDEGERCQPGYPDPCQPGHYCSPNVSGVGGICAKTVSAGRTCKYSSACERGFYCAGPNTQVRSCIAPFSVAVGQNITIGPYMCSSANAVLVQSAANPADSIYQCVDANATLVGQSCDSRARTSLPLGYECKCSSDGQSRLVTAGLLGVGSRSQVWRDLYNCLNLATGVMGDLCEFDSLDLERVRYGSCGYYECYPYYLSLVNVTGARAFRAPLNAFDTSAQCEVDAVSSYYTAAAATECLTLPNLENWKCAKLDGPHSLSVSGTSALVTILILFVAFAYWWHMVKFRKENGTYFHPILVKRLRFLQ